MASCAERNRTASSAQPDLSLVRPVQAVEDAHQRRLAGAVLAEQRQDLALPQLEVDRVVGERAAGKPLGDAAQLDQGGRAARGWRIADHYWGTNGTSSVPALIAARASSTAAMAASGTFGASFGFSTMSSAPSLTP